MWNYYGLFFFQLTNSFGFIFATMPILENNLSKVSLQKNVNLAENRAQLYIRTGACRETDS